MTLSSYETITNLVMMYHSGFASRDTLPLCPFLLHSWCHRTESPNKDLAHKLYPRLSDRELDLPQMIIVVVVLLLLSAKLLLLLLHCCFIISQVKYDSKN